MELQSVMTSRTATIAERAKAVLAGGVSAAARYNAALGGPMFVARGHGAWLTDVDGRELIDFNASQGATLLGHGHPAVRAAVEQSLEHGIVASFETEFHTHLAELICDSIPAAERVRFATSGTEATLTAVRLARAATGRQRILKFEGHYHGLHDLIMWNTSGPSMGLAAEDGAIPVRPDSAGTPIALGDLVVVAPWNNAAAFEQAMTAHGDTIAAVICEPVNYNAGCIPPRPGFLRLLRDLSTRHGAVLIFDEVLTGFRMALGGAQAHYGVEPDLFTLAKALASGMPLAAIAGRADLMEQFAPTGPVSHSGTYSGHLSSVLAAITTLEILRQDGFYDRLNARANRFYADLSRLFEAHQLPVKVQGVGARFGLYFGLSEPIWDYPAALGRDPELARRFSLACYERGVYFGYSRAALSHHGLTDAHDDAVLAEALRRIDSAVASLVR